MTTKTSNKHLIRTITLALLIATLAACSPTATAVPTPSPTLEPQIPPEQTRQVSFEGITFAYDSALAPNVTGEVVASRYGEQFPPWEQSPSHIAFTFVDSYASQRPFFWQAFTPTPEPMIFIYRTVDLPGQELGWDARSQVEALTTLLADRLARPEAGIPVLPLVNAAQMFTAQVKYLDFTDGSGVRFITQYSQEARTVNNQEVFYTFQGLSTDGAYYVAAFFPVTTSALPEGFAMTNEEYQAFMPRYQAYINETIQGLNGLSESDFEPDLTMLDAVIQSLELP